jgi:hypothetical protein
MSIPSPSILNRDAGCFLATPYQASQFPDIRAVGLSGRQSIGDLPRSNTTAGPQWPRSETVASVVVSDAMALHVVPVLRVMAPHVVRIVSAMHCRFEEVRRPGRIRRRETQGMCIGAHGKCGQQGGERKCGKAQSILLL